MRSRRAFAWMLPLAAAAFATSVIPWEDLTEGDWLYALATRFALVDGHKVHYPTPTAELAKLLEGRTDPAALRHLAEARLALGDRKGALDTMERWAATQGAQAWAETARWEAAHQEPAAAFKAAERALTGASGLSEEDRRTLCDERITWAEAHPDLADAIQLRKAKAELFPGDVTALEAWLRALEGAGRLAEADQGLAAAQALPPERRLLVRSDLKADHGEAQAAFQILDAAVLEPWSPDFSRAYARRTDKAAGTAPGLWRGTLEARYEPGALVRLFTYLEGASRTAQAVDLLRQVERRYEKNLARPDELLLARLYARVDAVPEAFRAALAAAHLGSKDEQTADLAALAQLALRAGGRPLAWGNYNDEAYKWVAAVDRTPGFWTGGISFLLTGLPWKETLDNLESQSLPDRTFATARALAETLARREPGHAALPSLRVAIMARHVERGEGNLALALLPVLEQGPADVADQARHQALLAARQAPLPLAEELRLMKARLRYAAADGTRPTLDRDTSEDSYYPEDGPDTNAWTRLRAKVPGRSYGRILNESIARLDQLDPSHRPAVDLVLTELDRLPDAETLWLHLASRLEGWNLDDGLGPRYQEALKRFQDPGLWDKAARWYARRSYHAELRQLADDVTARFRGSALFQRGGSAVVVQVPSQPPVGAGVRMVLWADWVRLKALERFPHSPLVFSEAGRLVTPAQWQTQYDPAHEARATSTKVIVPENLLEERRWAILFVDPGQREAFFAAAMRKGNLQAVLTALEARTDRTPVEDQLLFEGWARLSRFESAVEPGERLCRAYPGDGGLAQRMLSLHRSLNGLEASHAAAARTIVERTAPALEDPNPLWTELGEMEEDRGRGQDAIVIWRNLLARSPRNPDRIAELATLLWDYNHDKEALEVVEAGRKALGRPRFYAFETGVLRENQRDLIGAVREYLEATRPEQGDCFCSWYDNDQRSLRRLSQLLARPKVYALVEARIKALAAGSAEDEKALAAFFPLGTITPPDPGLAWDADTWIDQMDLPNDPVGRDQRQAQKAVRRPGEFDAITRIGDLMLEKARDMVPKATTTGFLDFADQAISWHLKDRWPKARAIDYQATILARRAQLAASEEDRIRLDMERAQFLADNDRVKDADLVWSALAPRLDKLPEGSVKLRAESQRAGYLERSKGMEEAAGEWRRITQRHPWSLGLLQDRLAFLDRAKLGEEALTLLETTVPRAASGHRENLLEQLTQASLAASDLPRARKAAEQLLAQEGLEDTRRLAAVHLLARLNFRTQAGWDPFPLAKAQAPLVKPEVQADLYYQLAMAADLEHAPATALWIEALNRRTERTWLVAAARCTLAQGKGPEFLAFFEKQRERSPRDVRWAVAVRDIKRFVHDVDGAVEAAKAAVTVRPEQEPLWRDAVEILVRADRIHEAADYLEGWNRPRQGSEDVARWRSELYARAGDGARALAVEQEALKAFAREGSADADEKEQRRTRAGERLFALGHPELVTRLYSPTVDVAPMASRSGLPVATQARIALLLGQFPRLLMAWEGNPDRLSEAGGTLAGNGRPEQKDEIQAWLVQKLFPVGTARPEAGALNTWWPFLGPSGLEAPVRTALAQCLVSATPGPWQLDAPFPFTQAVGATLISTEAGRQGFRSPDLPRLWAQELARRDRSEELLAFLEPRWQELLAQVKGASGLSSGSARQGWTSWMDDRAVLATWARAAQKHPEKLKELGDVMSDRHLWDRFWALAARGWAADTLVAVLPEGPRLAWFRFWEPSAGQDPVLLARRATVDNVDRLMARLVRGEPGAALEPLLDKLRGPRTVGDVLGKDPRWVWAEFSPRRDARGENLEKGDDRVVGQDVDRGREPGALWGEHPGQAWFVLEALARYRQGDATAPWLPLEGLQRDGQETQRVLLAMRLARLMGDLPLANRFAETRPGPAKDWAWQEGRLELLTASDRGQEAAEAFRTYVRSLQGELNETRFQDLGLLATRLGLPAPMTCLDPAQPVGPVFLAYLQDSQPQAAHSLHTADVVDYRIALANRWESRTNLTRAQARYWFQELWATGSANANPKVLARLGSVWSSARPWLEGIPVPERTAALASLDAALDPANPAPALLAELTRPGTEESNELLALRIRLARKETDQALALVDHMLAELGPVGTGGNVIFNPVQIQEEGAPAAEDAGEEGRDDPKGSDAVDRLEVWLAPFKAAGKARPVEDRFLKRLADQRRAGLASPRSWQFAFRHTLATEAPALAQELEEAWFRGEVTPYGLGDILEAAAPALGGTVARWLSRMQEDHTYRQTRQRMAILELAKQPGEAVKVLLAARNHDAWSTREEVEAFDAWRRLGTPAGLKAPAYWTGASAVWSGAASLGDRLKAHPHDVFAARAALRNLGPGDDNALARAGFILATDRPWARDPDGDRAVLLARRARGLMAQSPAAASAVLGGAEPEALVHLFTERKLKAGDIDATLADLARIAARLDQAPGKRRLMALLAERKAPNLKALEAELAPAPGKADAFRLDNGRPVPIRPRDLTWAMLTNVLNKEGAK